MARPPVTPLLVAAALVVAALAAACSSDDGASTASTTATSSTAPSSTAPSNSASSNADGGSLTFPGDAWATESAADAGMDQAKLDELGERARAAGSACVVVTRNGKVVYDASWPGPTTAPREAFSVTKSLTSILVGIAQRDGHLKVSDPVSKYVPQWQGTPSSDVTIQDVLSNTSGREWSLRTDYAEMAFKAPDKTAFAIGLGQADAPGTVWAYNNSAIQVLSAVLSAATGMTPSRYAAEQVFGPIGMAQSTLRTDASGGSLTFMGLSTTCQDLARMGLLMLAHGTWGSGAAGTNVLAADYVADSTGRSSSELNAAYGRLWWVNRPGHVASPTAAVRVGDPGADRQGQLVPGAPEDAFWALGMDGQYVAVIPEDGIVAVRLGSKPPAEPPFEVGEFTNGVLAAVTD